MGLPACIKNKEDCNVRIYIGWSLSDTNLY